MKSKNWIGRGLDSLMLSGFLPPAQNTDETIPSPQPEDLNHPPQTPEPVQASSPIEPSQPIQAPEPVEPSQPIQASEPDQASQIAAFEGLKSLLMQTIKNTVKEATSPPEHTSPPVPATMASPSAPKSASPPVIEIAPSGEMPPLPRGVLPSEEYGEKACQWLNEYVQFSRYWSPRGYSDFHEAIAAWVLSTVASRRVWLPFGPGGEYTPLFIALVARTTQYAKSTTAGIGKEVLHAAGLSWRLCPDTITPQKLINEMSGPVPMNYTQMGEEEQARTRRRMAMRGQIGWYYDEFGQQMDEMAAKSGIMAEYRSMLRRFDDCESEVSYATLARHIETIYDPYLAMLACTTIADIRPHARRGNRFWNDGFFARVAFITPPPGQSSQERFPEGQKVVPATLSEPLRLWHDRLGERVVQVTEEYNKRRVFVGHLVHHSELPRQTCQIDRAVVDAYYTYSQALAEIVARQQLEALEGNYARLPCKALRLSILFASLEANGHITMTHWCKAAHITERWRASLHQLFDQVNQNTHVSTSAQAESDLLDVIRRLTKKMGPPTAREIGLYYKRYDTATLQNKLENLVRLGVLKRLLDRRFYRFVVCES